MFPYHILKRLFVKFPSFRNLCADVNRDLYDEELDSKFVGAELQASVESFIIHDDNRPHTFAEMSVIQGDDNFEN